MDHFAAQFVGTPRRTRNFARSVARGVRIICSTTALAAALMLAPLAGTITPSSAVVEPARARTFRTTCRAVLEFERGGSGSRK